MKERMGASKTAALHIDIDTEYGDRFKRFGTALPNIVNYSLGDIAHDIAQFIKDRFLTGRAMDRITGATYESVTAYQPKKKDAWHIAPGVGISREVTARGKQGGLAYLARWNGTSREFMQPGLAEYVASGKYMDLVEANLERMERKMEVL